jgi:hypothetical protein
VTTVFRSLSAKIFVFLALLLAIMLMGYAWLNQQTISKIWVTAESDHAIQTSELIRRATHYGMLLNRKDDVHQTIRSLAQQPGIAGIRIYDKQGNVMFSADPGDIGKQVDMNAEACVLCHKEGQPLQDVPTTNRMRIFEDSEGGRTMGLIPLSETSRAVSTPRATHTTKTKPSSASST